MKLYEWEFKLFEKDGICQVNMKLSTTKGKKIGLENTLRTKAINICLLTR